MKKVTPKQVKRTLREERLKCGWSQQELAERLGTTTVTISRWENGTATPSPYFRLKLSQLFQKDAEALGLFPATKDAPDNQIQEALLAPNTNSAPVLGLPLPLQWLPYRRNPFFIGREAILQHLHTLFQRDRAAGLQSSYALTGLGGIGKTQTALEYAYRYASDYAAVFWISAETSENMLSNFVAIADLLNLPENGKREQRRTAEAVLRWLNSHNQWLLIFDNVEDIELVKSFLPSTHQGSLLFTSRRQALSLSIHILDLEKMAAEEGLLFLLHRARLLDPAASLDQIVPTDTDAARAIVAMMDGLPLALDQAGAYIEATQCSLSDYLHLLQFSPLRLLAEREPHADHPLSVTQTFTLAFERLEQSNTHAIELLTVCAFLAPEDIPERLFLEGAEQLGPPFETLVSDPFAFQAAIKALLAYSLLQRHTAAHTLTTHRLVQVTLQHSTPKTAQAEWIKRVIQTVDHVFPIPSQSQHMECWSWCEQIVPHALKVLSTQQEVLAPLAASSLWYKTAAYLSHRGRYLEAENYHQQALDVREQVLGSQHPGLSDPLIGLVEATSYLGKYPAAIRSAQRVIGLLEHTQGANHFGLVKPLNMLARIYRIQGQLAEAERLLLRSLSIWITRVLQEGVDLEPPSSIIPRQAGEEPSAQTLIHQALSLWEQAPKHHHGPVGQALTFLSHVYQQQQRYEEAEAILLPALRIGKLALGEQHYILTIALMILAEVYKGQGRLEEAEVCYSRVLAIRKEALGFQHSQVMEARTGYVTLLRAMGREEEAVHVEKLRLE